MGKGEGGVDGGSHTVYRSFAEPLKVLEARRQWRRKEAHVVYATARKSSSPSTAGARPNDCQTVVYGEGCVIDGVPCCSPTSLSGFSAASAVPLVADFTQ